MKKCMLACVISSLLGVNGQAYAESVPAGFEELSELSRTLTKIVINDDNFVEVWTSMSHNTAVMESTDKKALQDFLRREYLNINAIETVTERLLTGIESSAACIGLRESCQISEDSALSIQFVTVQHQALIRVLIPESGMSSQAFSRQYINDSIDQNAILMHHRMNVSEGSEIDASVLYRNTTTAGVLGGYVQSDLNLTSNKSGNANDQHLYFDELSYNYLIGNHRFRVGYISSSVDRTWNSTTLLDTNERISTLSVDFGTTRALEFKSRSTAERLFFTTPISGRLIVTREDGTIILEKNVQAGQNYLSYNELPRGISTLELKVMSGETELYQSVHKIYNTGAYRLKDGEFDFQVSLGLLDEQENVLNVVGSEYMEEYAHDAFIDSRITTQVGNSWTLGAGIFNTTEDYYLKAATTYTFSNDLVGEALFGHFNDDSQYGQISLNIYGVNINWSKFSDNHSDIGETSLANFFYGFGSYQDFTASYNHRIARGNLYFTYSRYKSQQVDSFNQLYEEPEEFNEYESFIAGYSFGSFWRSTVDISTTYTDYSSSHGFNGVDDDQFQFSLTVSVPIGATSYASYSGTGDKDSQYHRAAVSNRYEINDDLSLTAEAGLRHHNWSGSDSDTVADASLSTAYQDRNLRASAYGYIDSDDSRSVYADMSMTTVFSNGDVYATPKKSDSYLIVNNKNAALTSLDAEGGKFLSVANLKGNGDGAGRLTLDEDRLIFPIDSYQEYQVILDESASDYHNSGESSVQGSSYPGTVITLDVNMKEVKTYISVFNDIEGRPIDEVTCLGTGCLGIEELAEGVFQFKISQGEPFVLQSHNQRCLIPAPSEFERQNLGTNFCMPIFELHDGIQIVQGENGHYYYYVGEFSNDEVIKKYEQLMEGTPFTFIRKQVGTRLFLFVESQDLITQIYKDNLESLSSYALEEQDSTPYVSR
ncbi:MAG: CS1-pili formation C-terminal domain-containing protein [Shewanella sp.]